MHKPRTRARLDLLSRVRAALPAGTNINETMSDRQLQELAIRRHFPGPDLAQRSDSYVASYFARLEPYFELRARNARNQRTELERTDARDDSRPIVVDDDDVCSILEGGIPRTIAREDAESMRAAARYDGAVAHADDVLDILDGAVPANMARPLTWHERQRLAARHRLPDWRQPLGDHPAEPPRHDPHQRVWDPEWRKPLGGHHRARKV